jgi:ATP-binding cassette subfamily B protein
MNRMPDSATSDLGLCRRLLREVRPYRRHMAAILLLDLLGSALVLLLPLPLVLAVDCALGGRPLPGWLDAVVPGSGPRSDTAVLVLAVVLLITVAVLSRLQGLGSSLLRLYTGEKMVLGFRARLFAQAQRLSLSYHDRKGTADAAYRIHSDAAALQHVAIDGVIPLITETVTLAVMVYVIFRLDWQLALVAVAIAPVLFVISGSYRRRLRRQSRDLKHLESSIFSIVQEVLVALRVVKAFGQEEREQERYAGRSAEGMRARLRLALAEGIYGLLVGVTLVAGTAAVLFIGVGPVQTRALQVGVLVVVFG